MRTGARAVSLTNGLVATALVLALAAVALVVTSPAPPGIAEFAPQAAKPITKAPLGQAALAGTSGGACVDGQSCALPTTPPTTGLAALPSPNRSSGVPSALQCYTWPDGSVTQTFDPQSPPCIASWDSEQGNGGTTTRGVTKSEIRVGVPDEFDSAAKHQALADFFNRHYTLYGRSLRVVPLGGIGATPEQQVAFAESADEAEVFALTDESYATSTGMEQADTLVAALARKRIIAALGRSSLVQSTTLHRTSPYAWSFTQPFDVLGLGTADLVCKTLAGRPARQGSFAGQRRSFALLVPDTESNSGVPFPSTAELQRRMASCGATAERHEYNDAALADATTAQTFSALKAEQVSTVLLYGTASGLSSMVLPQASAAGYRPEWVVTGMDSQAAEGSWRIAPKDQTPGLLGLAGWNKPLAGSLAPHLRAAHENGSAASTALNVYQALSMIAAGVQAAGTSLTPESFAHGLTQLRFPNPGAGQAPSYQAAAGFGQGPWFLQDNGLVWWNPSVQGVDDNANRTGTFCYIALGRRWAVGDIPEGDPGYFDSSKPCR